MDPLMNFRLTVLAAVLSVPLALSACSKAAETPAETGAAVASEPETLAVSEAEIPAEPETPAEALGLDDMPGPAAGKWSVEATMDGRTMPVTEICFSESTLASLAQTPPGTTCTDQAVNRSGGSLKVHAVCIDAEGKKTTIDSVVTGDL